MKFRSRLQLFSMPIFLLGLALTTVLYMGITIRAMSDAERDRLATKLTLLEGRVESSYRLLSRIGLESDSYFIRNARETLVQSFMSVLTPGESFALFSANGEFLAGASWKGGSIDLDEASALYVLLDAGPAGAVPGDTTAPRPVPAPGTHLVNRDGRLAAYSSFPSWDWILVVAADKAVVFSSFRVAYISALLIDLTVAALIWIVFVLFSRRVTRPLTQLTRLAHVLGSGDFGAIDGIRLVAEEAGGEEITGLAREFEDMARKLALLTRGLETSVAERTEELERSNTELRETIDQLKATQDQLIDAEKMASLGQLVAGIAHEINTPIAAVSSAGREVGMAMGRLFHLLDLYRRLSEDDARVFRTLVEETMVDRPLRDGAEERRARRAYAERIASLGMDAPDDLADKLAEMNLPLRATDGYLETLVTEAGMQIVDTASAISDMLRSVRIIGIAADKAAQTVQALKIYSRRDDDEEPRLLDLRQELDTILSLYHNALKRGIEVDRDYAEVPEVLARRDRLSQVWINLVDNAIHAMSHRGRLEIAIRKAGNVVEVSITDSGVGIPEALQDRIFTPFFTTKSSGLGTGIGLNISKRIVEESGGTIVFVSRPGMTTFTVRLPVAAGALAEPVTD
jgi:signal transduction histidine kinase